MSEQSDMRSEGWTAERTGGTSETAPTADQFWAAFEAGGEPLGPKSPAGPWWWRSTTWDDAPYGGGLGCRMGFEAAEAELLGRPVVVVLETREGTSVHALRRPRA